MEARGTEQHLAALIALYMVVFAAPSVVSYWLARSARARARSFAVRGRRLALHRLVVVGVVVLVHGLLLGLLASAPKMGTPEPGHQYSAAFDAWRMNTMMSAILAVLVSLAAMVAIAVVFVREIIVLVQTSRARTRVLREADSIAPPDASTPMTIDFGVGDEAWIFRGPAREGYREATPILGWARGKPVVWRSLVGPIVSVVTVLTMFAFIGTDAILSMGD